MAITMGNPIIVTSGTMGTIIDGPNRNRKIDRFYWFQPTLESTSSLVLRKKGATGQVILNMACETSGTSQVMKINRWESNMFIDSMPTGTLYIHMR